MTIAIYRHYMDYRNFEQKYRIIEIFPAKIQRYSTKISRLQGDPKNMKMYTSIYQMPWKPEKNQNI